MLDLFFLRSFEPLFYNYGNEIIVYQCEKQSYPNGAIYISLKPYDNKMAQIIKYIVNKPKDLTKLRIQVTNLTSDTSKFTSNAV